MHINVYTSASPRRVFTVVHFILVGTYKWKNHFFKMKGWLKIQKKINQQGVTKITPYLFVVVSCSNYPFVYHFCFEPF